VELADKSDLKAKAWLDIGDQQFQDTGVQFTSLPSNLYGAEWFQPLKETTKGVQFKVKEDADVFVGTGNGQEKPQGFDSTKTMIINNKGERFSVYRKRLKGGGEFRLNFTPAVMAIVPSSDLAPAYDLKTITSYRATDAKLLGQHISKKVLMEKERIVFNQPSGDALQFEMSVGVADTYSLTLKYHNPTTLIQRVNMEFYSIDGTLMKTEELELAPTKEGKWNYLTTNTGSMVNAGKYLVKFMAINANSLAIDALDVQ
jgi:beta-galactosidase